MECRKCGHGNLHGSIYCSRCAAPLAKSSQRASRRAGTAGGIGVAGVLVGVGVLVAFMMVVVFAGSEVEGEIHARGKPFGDYVLRPTDCYSGQHQNFFGVWVAPELKKLGGKEGFQGGIKLMKTPLEEWAVYVESPVACQGLKCQIQELPRAQCKVFDIEVRNTNTLVNDIRVREGHAKLDCQSPEGGAYTAHLAFEGCQ